MFIAHDTARPGARREARVLLRAGLLAVPLALVGALLAPPAAWSAGAVLAPPKAPIAQPAAAEALQPYVPQTSCDPVTKSGVKKFRTLMLATYGRGYDGGTTRACAGAGVSEHIEGRAWDWMLNAGNAKDKQVATAALAWLLKKGPNGEPALQARRLGIMYLIYDGRIWGSWSGAWRPVRAGSDPHTSHIHFSFSWSGARGRTSFWTGKVARFDYGPCAAYAGQPAAIYTKANYAPCATALPKAPRSTHKVAWTGASTADVATAQKLLKVPAASRTATFGTTLRKAVAAYQRTKGLAVTGALDKATWVKLDPASKVISTGTTTSAGNATSSGGASSTGGATTAAWATLKVGSTGPKVVALQVALKLAAASRTGYFGSITLAAVKAFQKAHALEVDGVVGPKTAKALGLL